MVFLGRSLKQAAKQIERPSNINEANIYLRWNDFFMRIVLLSPMNFTDEASFKNSPLRWQYLNIFNFPYLIAERYCVAMAYGLESIVHSRWSMVYGLSTNQPFVNSTGKVLLLRESALTFADYGNRNSYRQ